MNEHGNNGCFVKGGTPWNKGLTKQTDNRMRSPTKYSMYSEPYIRNCPDCDVELSYSTVYYFANAIKKNRKCNMCSQQGNTNGIGNKGKTVSVESRKKMRISAIEYIKKQNGQIQPRYNIKSISLINDFAKENNYNFQHAENGGEYYIKELGYFLDAYDIEKNIVLEIDEKHHFRNGKLRKKDINRQQEIEKFLKCKFIRIKL